MDIKYSYSIVDPISFSTEVSRDLFYQNTTFLKLKLIKEIVNVGSTATLSLPLNTTYFNKLIFEYLLSSDSSYNNFYSNNLDLYKDQYRPMRKGISNMIKLHATGAVAMPTEIRLHLLASSKDVIHS
jgi:hypothetical protein